MEVIHEVAPKRVSRCQVFGRAKRPENPKDGLRTVQNENQNGQGAHKDIYAISG